MEIHPPYHILGVGGCSDTTLDFIGGRGSVRVGLVGKECATPHQLFLRVLWTVRIVRPGMSTGGFKHPDWDVQKSGTSEKRQEDGQDDVPPLPGSRYPVRDVI